jgi:type I restriction enzyme M protein
MRTKDKNSKKSHIQIEKIKSHKPSSHLTPEQFGGKMVNKISETKTENIFREKYGPNVFIEKSAIPSHYGFKSKKGTDFKGFPDFFLDQNDFVIVVEAKAKDHKSAEDEVKFYIENNRITKDIIGVAVSGQSSETLKVSYFFKEANSSEAKPIVSVRDVLLSLENIVKLFSAQTFDAVI